MKGLALFVACNSGRKHLLSFGQHYSINNGRQIFPDFFGIPTESAVEVFLSKQHCVENSVFDISFDNMRFISIPSTLSMGLSTFSKKALAESLLNSPLAKSKSDTIVNLAGLKLMPMISETPKSTPDSKQLKRQSSNEKNIEITLLTIVMVFDNNDLKSVSKIPDYTDMLKQLSIFSCWKKL